MHLCTDSAIRKALRIGLAATAVPHLRQNDVVSAPSRRCQNSLLASIEGIVFFVPDRGENGKTFSPSRFSGGTTHGPAFGFIDDPIAVTACRRHDAESTPTQSRHLFSRHPIGLCETTALLDWVTSSSCGAECRRC